MSQTYLVSGQNIEEKGYSGITYIDALLNQGLEGEGSNIPIKWLSDPFISQQSPSGKTVITYSFPSGGTNGVPFSYQDDVGDIAPIGFNSTQKEDIRAAFDVIEKYVNIDFIEITEEGDKVGTIRLAINTITDEQGNYLPGIAATADPIYSAPRGGDIWFNKWFVNADFSDGLVPMWDGSTVAGSQTHIGDVTILYHEIFHALGVEHPGDNLEKPFPEELNHREYSVMAGEFSSDDASTHIIDYKQFAVASTPMAYDIATLQYLYGANYDHNKGNTLYSFDFETPEIKSIWDGDGVDTLNFENFPLGNTIRLEGGSYSSIPFNGWSMENNISIAFGVTIENIISGAGDDSITGNSSNNKITGGVGSDEIDGGDGIDTAVYSVNFNEAVLSKESNPSPDADGSAVNWTVTVASDKDSLSNIERLQFSDTHIALDISGNAGKVVKLLGALLGKNAASNKDYIGEGIKILDSGTSYEQLMGLAVNYVFGAEPEAANLIGSIYENLVGSEAPQSIIDEYSAALNSGALSPEGLAMAASEHEFNAANIDLIGLSSSGVEFTLG